MAEKLIVIGSGPSGYTASIYASRAHVAPLLFEGFQAGGIPGGQLMITGLVENFPGFPEGINGQDLMANMRQQAEKLGTRMLMEDVEEVRMDTWPFKVISMNGQGYDAHAIIIATGATARRLPLPSEKRLWGKGISACAVCDGALPVFRNRDLAVIGGGDTAIEEAVHLTAFGSKIYLIHRRDAFRASAAMQERVTRHPKIEILYNKIVEEIVGDSRLDGIVLKDTVTGSVSKVAVAGAFEAIGHTPNTRFLNGQLALDEQGYIVTGPNTTKTTVPGIFAAGDVQDPRFRQAITAAGSGCMAALEAEWFLREKGVI